MNLRSLEPRLVIALIAALVVLPRTAPAHVGSPDVFLDARAGPYRVFVTVRPPRAIPGVAGVEVLTSEGDVREVRIVPMPLAGPGAQFAPAPDLATQSREDPRLYTGQLWMMTAGAWQVRVAVDGSRGSGTVAVPVPTLPQATLDMGPTLRAVLFALMVLLSAGFVSIVAALGREAGLEPGEAPGSRARRRGRIAGAIATGIVITVVALGNWWWTAEASSYARYVYKPLEASTAVAPDGRLTLALRDPGWIALRRTDDLVADHGHLMHLFILSPALDRFWHLHPGAAGSGTFEQLLPNAPQGEYELFADVVHSTGISETITGRLATSGIRGSALTGDDSAWSTPSSGVTMDTAPLPDGGRMVWVRDGRPLEVGQLTMFTFRVDDAAGRPATDLELYMGMPGHAIFVRRDRRVFAHVHPSGSAPMAAMQIGERSLGRSASAAGQDHTHGSGGLPAVVSFPFGLPERGDYRIFVQVKRSGRIETGAFDARVESSPCSSPTCSTPVAAYDAGNRVLKSDAEPQATQAPAGGGPTMDQDALNEREWAQPGNWSRWGIYRSARDTRVWVPKRNPRLGWTLNTAHRAGRLSLLALLLLPLALLLIFAVIMMRLIE